MQSLATFLIVTLLASAGSGQSVGETELPDGTVQHAVTAEDMPWGPCPPTLPAGCEIAVLEGDPQGSGLFTVRFRLAGGLTMPPHSHPNHERVTVLAGRMAVAFEPDGRDRAREFGPGDYYVNAREAVHSVWVVEPAVIQITGVGPWRADFVADSP